MKSLRSSCLQTVGTRGEVEYTQ